MNTGKTAGIVGANTVLLTNRPQNDEVSVEKNNEIYELAGRMYEAADIQRAIEEKQFTTVEQVLEAVKARASYCSKQLEYQLSQEA